MVAFLIPWFVLRPRAGAGFDGIAVGPLAAGVFLLLWCVREFYVAGRGTLAPWAPPERLVVSGPYRLSRNPMYVAVTSILIGWALAYGSRALWIYAASVAVAFYVRVVWMEEPWLARRHGAEWDAYRSHVARWLGRRRPQSA